MTPRTGRRRPRFRSGRVGDVEVRRQEIDILVIRDRGENRRVHLIPGGEAGRYGIHVISLRLDEHSVPIVVGVARCGERLLQAHGDGRSHHALRLDVLDPQGGFGLPPTFETLRGWAVLVSAVGRAKLCVPPAVVSIRIFATISTRPSEVRT